MSLCLLTGAFFKKNKKKKKENDVLTVNKHFASCCTLKLMRYLLILTECVTI